MIIAGFLSLTLLDNATDAFNILLLSGAGSGAIYLLRWFWWRINAFTEIVAMVVATIMAVTLVLFVENETMATDILDGFTVKLLVTVGVVTVAWIITTLVTKPEDDAVLRRFYALTQPGGPGWRKVVDKAREDGEPIDEGKGVEWQMPRQLLLVFIGAMVIYSSLFAIGGFVYGNMIQGVSLLALASVGTFVLFKVLAKLKMD